MMVTLLAPTLAMNASLPFGLKVTLWAPLSAGIVVISLSVAGSKTCTFADFMLVTQSSAAQLSLTITPVIKMTININGRAARIIFTRPIFCSSAPMAPNLQHGSPLSLSRLTLPRHHPRLFDLRQHFPLVEE